MSLLTQYSTWNTERYLYLDCLFMRTEYRGLGTGQKLMAMASNYTKELNLSEVQWQTPNDNIDAIRFYKKQDRRTKIKNVSFGS
jgi:ribosomal protein S18 acetylase RimI-like enzyme